jgi:hypothetical protein
VAGLSILQLVELGEGIIAGVMAGDTEPVPSDPGKALAANRAAEKSMVRALAFLAEAQDRTPTTIPQEEN